MNVPQYRRALEMAMNKYRMACEEARDSLEKAIAVANEAFLEDPDELKAAERDMVIERDMVRR